MTEFSGSELKRKREEMRIPLEQVATATRIRLSILQDLEDEEYAELSSSAQTKGFLRLYADYLGLNDSENETGELTVQEETPRVQELAENDSPEQDRDISKGPFLIEIADTAAQVMPTDTISTPEPQIEHEIDQPESDSQKMLRQLGRELSSRRRYLNLAWDLISQQTRLAITTLKALENGDLLFFTTPLDFRKNLQTYARFLNLDVEAISIRFAEALQKRRYEKQPKKIIKRNPSKPVSQFLLNIKRFFTLDLFFGTILILGILAFLIWGMSNMRPDKGNDTIVTQTLPGVIDFLLTTPTETKIVETEEPEAIVTVGIPTVTPFFVQSAPEEGLSLSLHARQNIWIRVFCDDKLSYQGRLPSGEVKSFTADESFELETSNIAALEMAFQGAAIEPIYRAFGSPARFHFDADGMTELAVHKPTPNQQESPSPPQSTPGAP